MARSGRSVGAVIEDALRDALAPRVDADDLRGLPVLGGSGVQPGVDLTDLRSVTEVMDGEHPTDALR